MSEPLPQDHEATLPVLEYARPIAVPWERTLRVLVWLDLLVSLVATILCAIEVETIVGTGPVLLALGILLAIFAGLARRPVELASGLSRVVVVVGVFLLINLRRWSPNEAQLPVTFIAFANLALVITLALLATARRGRRVAPTARRWGASDER